MYFLAIDTATNSGGVALARNAEVIGTVMVKRPLEYSERLISTIEFLIRQFDLELSQIDCFSVAAGPGSFTGLRIGMATVKGFCQSLDRPGVDISTLEALAYRFRHLSDRVAPMVDARRQQVFAALFQVGDQEIRRLIPEQVQPPAEWLKQLPAEPCLLVGDGAQMYASTAAAIRPADRLIRSDNCILNELCQLAYHRFVRGETRTAAALAANYVRPPDAQRPVVPAEGRA